MRESAPNRFSPRRIRSFALRVFLALRSVVFLPVGYVAFVLTNRTPEPAYQSLIWLFCTTRGRFNDWLSAWIARRRSKTAFSHTCGMLGDVGGPTGEALVRQLRDDGFLLFPRALPADACDRLMQMALSTPATVRRMADQPSDTQRARALFDPDRPQAVRYDYDPSSLLDQADVQRLLSDLSFLHIAQEYLGCTPVADVLSMWWHASFKSEPDEEAAQFFHFDMDRVKWLKIFIYLTDVGPDNGPHSFVKGSHRSGGIPSELLNRGYVRLADDDVARHYPPEAVLSLTAPRGSIIIEDTRGLHKGVHVRGGPRLILQLQFSNSLFGTNYPPAHMSRPVDPQFKHMLATAPAIYRQYV